LVNPRLFNIFTYILIETATKLFRKKQKAMENKIIFERVYKGKILKIDHIHTSSFGLRIFKIHFKSGSAFYEISQKQEMIAVIGNTIRFTMHKFGKNNEKVYITDIIDSFAPKNKDKDREVVQVTSNITRVNLGA